MPDEMQTKLVMAAVPANATYDFAHIAFAYGAYWVAEMSSCMRKFETFYRSFPTPRQPIPPGSVQIKMMIAALPSENANLFAQDAFENASAHMVLDGSIRCESGTHYRKRETM